MTKLTSPSFPLGIPPLRTESQARLGILPKTEYSGVERFKRHSNEGLRGPETVWEKSKSPFIRLWGTVDWCGFWFGFGIVAGPFCWVVLR